MVCLTVMESNAAPRNPTMDIYFPRRGQWSACTLGARAASYWNPDFKAPAYYLYGLAMLASLA